MIESVKQFLKQSGQTAGRYNPEQMGLYIGLILEEVGELLIETNQFDILKSQADNFKSGKYISELRTLCERDRVYLILDHCMDIAWVAYGLAFSMGCDVHGAGYELGISNHSKLADGLKDNNGKIMKGPSYKPANFSRYI